MFNTHLTFRGKTTLNSTDTNRVRAGAETFHHGIDGEVDNPQDESDTEYVSGNEDEVEYGRNCKIPGFDCPDL